MDNQAEQLKDVPGVEFPIRVYNRPSIAVANLLSGHPVSAMKALVNPMSLTPDELQSMRTKFLKGAGDNVVTKTIADLATDPFVLLGLAVELIPGVGNVANSQQLIEYLRKGTRYVKDTTPYFNRLQSAVTGFRALHHLGWAEEAGAYHAATQKYVSGLGGDLRRATTAFLEKNGKPLTKYQELLIGAKLDGFGDALKTKKIIDKDGKVVLVPMGNSLQRYYKSIFGGDKPIMAGLNGEIAKQGKHFEEYVNRYSGLYKNAKSRLNLNESDEALEELAKRGIEGRIEEGYFPHIMSKERPVSITGMTGGLSDAQYKQFMAKALKFGRAGNLKARIGSSMPVDSEIDQLMHLMDPDMANKMKELRTLIPNRIKGFLGDLIKTQGRKMTPEMIDSVLSEVHPDAMLRIEEAGLKAPFLDRLYKDLIGLVDSKNPEKIERVLDLVSSSIGAPARYSLEAGKVTTQYINSTAPTYAWLIKGHGQRLSDIVEKGVQEVGLLGGSTTARKELQKDFTDAVAPMMRGFMTPREYARTVHWNNAMERVSTFLTGNETVNKILPKNAREWMMNQISGGRGGLTEESLGHQIAGLFYGSTLGLNMSTISMNLMQNPITTANMTGVPALLGGLKTVAGRMPKFMELSTKVGVEIAMKRTFPEYWKQFGREGIAAALAGGDVGLEGKTMAGAAKSGWNAVKQGMMAPFSASEKFNRLWSFYSFHNKAVSDGLGKIDAGFLSGYMTKFTQFGGGVEGQPALFRGAWPPLKQFLHFPTRYAEYLAGSQAMGADPTRMNLGVLTRTMAGSSAIYTIARNVLGIDLSRGLAAEAIPNPGYEKSAFYPFPFVPPMVSVMGDVAKSVASGDYSQLENTAWLGVPSGIAVRRGWKAMAPKYADYQNRTPDGRIPTYNDKGMLIGSLTPMELVMKGIGLKSVGVEGEKEAMKYLLGHRERIREYRRQFVQAIASNDLTQASEISQTFAKNYPGAGPLTIKKSDIKAETDRRTMSRIQRTMRSFPQELKPQFQEAIDLAGLGAFSQKLNQMAGSESLYANLGRSIGNAEPDME